MADKTQTGERVPPHSREAEEAVLGAMMLQKEAVFRAMEIIQDPSAFYFGAHRLIFTAMTKLFEEAEPVDMVTVSTKMEELGSLEKAGGSFYVSSLVDKTPSAANVDYHVEIVKQKATLRSVIALGTTMVSEGFNGSGEVDELLDSFEHRLFDLSEGRLGKGFSPIEPFIHGTVEEIDRLSNTKGFVTGIPSGYDDLDLKTAGFQKTNLAIIAARPSMGKTALALSMTHNMAIKHNIPVGFFSLEMSSQEIALRLLCMEARVSTHRVKTRMIPKEKRAALGNAANNLYKLPIYIDDTPGIGILELRAKARRLKSEVDVGILFVDYLQLMSGPARSENRQQEIAAISRALKSTAKELDIPIIALSQLSRAPEQRGKDKRPQLSDLRESGALEQDADLVLFIYRENMYDLQKDDYQQSSEDVAELIIGKQRNGPTGIVRLTFLSEYARFEQRAPELDLPPF